MACEARSLSTLCRCTLGSRPADLVWGGRVWLSRAGALVRNTRASLSFPLTYFTTCKRAQVLDLQARKVSRDCDNGIQDHGLSVETATAPYLGCPASCNGHHDLLKNQDIHIILSEFHYGQISSKFHPQRKGLLPFHRTSMKSLLSSVHRSV